MPSSRYPEARRRPWRQRWPVWIKADMRGFYAGFRLPDGAIHFGVRLFADRGGHYGNARHTQYGVAFWLRRNRNGQRGYPHTVTLKVVVA